MLRAAFVPDPYRDPVIVPITWHVDLRFQEPDFTKIGQFLDQFAKPSRVL
jgi:hypothetical protein